MTELSQLMSIAKASSQSFHQQKRFIKDVLVGKTTQCPVCHGKLSIYLTSEHQTSSIQCAKKCTDIELDCT